MKTYLFDFDGTLVDSMTTFVGVMLRILDENGIEYDGSIVKVITPLGYRGTAEYYRTLGVKESVNDIVGKMNAYALAEYAVNIEAKPFVKEALAELRSRGCSLNVLTASPHTMLDPCLKRIGLYDLFDNVWSCDDFGTTKSDPDIYVQVAERMGVRTCDVLFLDDNFNALKTAKSVGMSVCGVYDASSDEYMDEIKAIADGYVSSFAELV
jgi:HAD superfamily hydrolase (TIGR01509 family)